MSESTGEPMIQSENTIEDVIEITLSAAPRLPKFVGRIENDGRRSIRPGVVLRGKSALGGSSDRIGVAAAMSRGVLRRTTRITQSRTK